MCLEFDLRSPTRLSRSQDRSNEGRNRGQSRHQLQAFAKRNATHRKTKARAQLTTRSKVQKPRKGKLV